MIKITSDIDYENMPYGKFIKDFIVAFAECNTDYIANCFTDDAVWHMAGGSTWDGKASIAESLRSMGDSQASEIVIDNIISDGDLCASNGKLMYPDGTGVTYCDVYEFTRQGEEVRIKSLTAYAIDLK